ncbi:hypothetical protein V8E54_014909 [Elaphomyces granulatus]|jgi:hypothetical protein
MFRLLIILVYSLWVSAQGNNTVIINGTSISNSTNSGLDPINNFCKRLSHQSTIKNGTLYIDGGLEVFVPQNIFGGPNGTLTLGYNTYILEVDMSASWDWKSNISMVAINKTANPTTGTYPPVVINAALYAGSSTDENIYLYGGTVSFVNITFPGFQYPQPPVYSLWSYNTTTKLWDQHDVTLSAPNRPFAGAFAEVPQQGLAFWLNGEINNGSSNTFATEPDFSQNLGGLIVLNTTTQTARNLSTTNLGDRFPREGGTLNYIPGIGQKGILVAIGGSAKATSNNGASSTGTLVPMDTIDIFDVASMDDPNSNGAWYAQAATGNIPQPRFGFCTVAATAPDNSSYNLYIYGGRNYTDDMDDIYVLSIPSFTWINIYQGSSPRWGHTCHPVGNSQMITVGGANGTSLYNGCDWETMGVAIYSLSTLTWGSVYNAFAPPYTVPNLVYNVIGGSAKGGATAKIPNGGFSSALVANLFGVPTSNTTSSNSTSSSTSGTNNGVSGGVIAGATIGAVAGVAVIVAAAFLILRRRRPPPGAPAAYRPTTELEAKKDGDPSKLLETELPSEFPGDSQVYESPGDAVVHEMDTNDKRISKYRHVSELDAQLDGQFPLSEPPPVPDHEPAPDPDHEPDPDPDFEPNPDQMLDFNFQAEPGHTPEPEHSIDPDLKDDPDYEVDPDGKK